MFLRPEKKGNCNFAHTYKKMLFRSTLFLALLVLPKILRTEEKKIPQKRIPGIIPDTVFFCFLFLLIPLIIFAHLFFLSPSNS